MSGQAATSKGLRRHARVLVASLVLLLALAWILQAGALPLVPPRAAFARISVSGAVLSGTLLLVTILLRLVRVQFLLAPIAHVALWRLMTISCVSLGFLTFLPFRLGEFARPAMLREKGKLSGWAITGTVGAERIIDGIAFSACLLLGLALAKPHEPLPDHIGDLRVPAVLVPRAAQFMALGFGSAFVLMVAFYLWRTKARRFLDRTLGVASKPLAERVASTLERLSDGLRFLPNLKYSGPYTVVTLAGLLLHAYSIQVLAHAVGIPELSFAQAIVVLGVLGLGFSLPNAPGFFGSFQIALYAGLAVYIAPEKVVNEGAVLVFINYLTYLGQVVALTLLGLGGEALASGLVTETRSG